MRREIEFDVPVAFWVLQECLACEKNFVGFFPDGRMDVNTPADVALECKSCGEKAVVYSSFISTAN